MNRILLLKRRHFAYIVLLVIMSVGLIFWAKAAHVQSEPIRIAVEFITHLCAKNYQAALKLIAKNGYTVKTAQELAANSDARYAHCGPIKLIGTFPFQSNGNRLRRWFSGRAVEMEVVTIEFWTNCLFGVTLHHGGRDQWKIFSFGCHAG